MEAISLSRKQEQFDVPFTGELPKLILVTEKLVLFKLAFLLMISCDKSGRDAHKFYLNWLFY